MELVDTHALGACAARREGSSPFIPTKKEGPYGSFCFGKINFEASGVSRANGKVSLTRSPSAVHSSSPTLMSDEIEQIRTIDWLKESIRDQTLVPEFGFDSFWLHHDHLSTVQADFWRSVVRRTNLFGGSLGFLLDETGDNIYPDALVFVFAENVTSEEAAKSMCDEAWRLMANDRTITFAELSPPNGHYQIDLFTQELDSF